MATVRCTARNATMINFSFRMKFRVHVRKFLLARFTCYCSVYTLIL